MIMWMNVQANNRVDPTLSGTPGRGAQVPYPLVERGWRRGDDVTLALVHVVT